jgi:signal transduction histidine kinase/response regulator of citrate/malate metabolism
MNQPQILTEDNSNKHQFNILLVEDNRGDVIIFNEILKSSGIIFSLTNAATLEESLELCRKREFDVILLDLGLPDSSGLETLKKIQISNVLPPIVVMTGLDVEDTALEALRVGAQDYLVKSKLTSDNILRSIKYGIERKKLQNLQEKNARQISIISSTTSTLNDCDDISLIYSIICQNIKKLISDVNVLSIEHVSRLKFRVSNIDWLSPWYDKIKFLTGIDLNKENFEADEFEKSIMNYFCDRNLHEIKGGLYELFSGKLDESACIELQQDLKIKNLYSIGFNKSNFLYGSIIIAASDIICDDNKKIIETIASEASLSINRKFIYKNLRLSETRVRKLNAELEQKVKERTEDLEASNNKLINELKERKLAQNALKESETKLLELNATKDKFFNIVAHDLKNPFTSLLGSTELLFENIDRMDLASIKRLAQILNDSAKSGYAILLNLLDWSRSQTGLIKFNPVRINLKSIIDDHISDFNLYSSNKNITIISEIEDDFFIFADENMINTIMRNLISNAVKFTHRYGQIIISATPKSHEIVISVKDTGIGLSPESLDKIFRIDSKHSQPGTDKEQGTGLGLKLCKEFVEQQGGEIWVQSIENKGSIFSFSIPIKQPIEAE